MTSGLYVCPSTEEIPEMGMIKALNMLAGLLDTHRFMVKQERFVPEDAVAQLKEWENGFTRHIIGPPFLIYRLLQFLKQTGQCLKLDRGSLVITLGGWKRFTGQMISRREFNLMCEQYLGLRSNGVRDIYALVESNVMAIDDEYQVKHVSPYIHFTVRDPEDLSKEVPVGEKATLQFGTPFRLVYDPVNVSRMSLANLSIGASFYLGSLWRTFGPAGLAFVSIGVVSGLVRKAHRSTTMIGLSGLAAFFVFYALQSLRQDYLIPAFPFLALLFGFGLLEAVRAAGRSRVLVALVLAAAVAFPLARSFGPLAVGFRGADRLTAEVKARVAEAPVVFTLLRPARVTLSIEESEENLVPVEARVGPGGAVQRIENLVVE